MYNKFEDKLHGKIICCDGLNGDLVEPNSIIKVTGKTMIEDYERLDFFLKQYNKLGEALAICKNIILEMQKTLVQSK